MQAIVGAWLLLVTGGCDTGRPREPEARSNESAAARVPAATVSLSDRLSRPPAPRVVAVGDLHGDLDHARRALRLAGAIDPEDCWTGGPLVVVQTGDEIDRGDDDRAILDEVETWKEQARTAGGDLVALLGNHELMNAALDFRYVTPGGFAAFRSLVPVGADLKTPPEAGRSAAFAPGGPYARMLAQRPLLVKVGTTLFVHGGILPTHVRYGLDRMNDEVDAWLQGTRAAPPDIAVSQDGPVWTRKYSADEDPDACATLAEALSRLGATRMVVGHTVQPRGITSACDSRVWRVDVGLSHSFGGPIEVLQLEGDRITVLREP